MFNSQSCLVLWGCFGVFFFLLFVVLLLYLKLFPLDACDINFCDIFTNIIVDLKEKYNNYVQYLLL